MFREKLHYILPLTAAVIGLIGCDTGPAPDDAGPLPAAGLIAYYPFDGNADDLGDSAFHGTVSGATLCSDRSGNEGKAYRFDGGNDYIDCGKIDVPGSCISISAWIRTTQETEGWIVAQFDGEQPYPGYGLQVFGGKAGFWNGRDFLREDLVGAPGVVIDSKWHHLACIQDETSTRLYVDGVMAGEQKSAPDMASKNNTMKIGRNAWHSVAFFKGEIDEVRLYNRALSSEEVLRLYDGSCP